MTLSLSKDAIHATPFFPNEGANEFSYSASCSSSSSVLAGIFEDDDEDDLIPEFQKDFYTSIG
jgi:hypothetical protein